MKKNLKRLTAIVAAIAMTVTGITFTPSKVDAAQANSCVIGSETTVGQWIYTVVQNQWNNEAASYNDASKVDGFIYSHDVYGWDGAYWKVRDLKSVYGLTAGQSYAMTINVKAPSNYTTSQTTTLNIRTTGGTADMAPTSKSLSPGAELTYTADVTPGTANFVLAIGYGNNGQGGAAGAQVGGFEIESITFTPKETTTNLYDWQRCPFDDTDFVPEAGSPWTLRSNNNASTAWGNQYYKMDSSKQVSDISRMHLKKDYVDGNNSNDWWWDSASLYGYGTTLGLDNGSAYTGTIVINTDTATSGSHTIRIVAFGHQYDVPLTAGDNEITIDKFKYNPADNDNIQFDYVEMPQNAEFYIKSIEFNSIYDGWTKAPFAIDSAISNSNWSTSVNNDNSSSYGDIRYKHDTTVDTNDPARITFKMAGAIGEAERTPQGARITDPAQRWWWMSADLTGNYKATVNKADGTSQTGNIRTILEEDERYTASIVVNSSEATLTDAYGNDTKLFVTPFGGTEQAFDLAKGDNTLSLQEFVFDGSDANLKFLFDELVADSELTVKSVTFTQVDDGWHKVKPNQDVTPSGSPWTLYADYQPDTDLSDGDQGLYGDMWYKVDGSGVSGTSIKPKLVAVGEPFYWNKATLKNYLSKTVAQGGAGLQDGHSYTGTISVSYTAGESEAGKTPKLRYVVEEAGTGEADKVLNSGSGTYTINLSEFMYHSDSANQDILFDLTGLEKDSIFKVNSITFTEVDADWTNVKGDTATANPWTLTANYDGVEQWGHMRYKQTGTGVASVQIKPMATAMGNHYYWNNAVLEDYLSDVANLTDGVEYDAQIQVQYTAGEAEAGETPQLRYIMAAANTGEANFDFDEGSKTYTIDLPTFTYDASAGKDDIEFELDGLEKASIFKVTEITFTPTGWTKVPNNTAFVPTGTPWTLTATNDQSVPGEEQWGNMSYKVDGTASNISSTLIKPNATAVGEHFYWNKAELKNYLATLQDGHSYTGSITFNYVSGTAVAGKTPELRTVIAAAGTGEMDTAVTAGSNTIAIDEFIYESTAENNDILFELDGLEEGSIFQVTEINFTEVDADWTNVKGGTATATPWILTANNNGTDQWGHLRYKQTGTGVSSIQVKPMNTSIGDHFYWNSAKLTDMTYGQTLTPGKEYSAVITVQYTAGEVESGKTPELLYNIPVAEVSEATKVLNSGSGTYTIDVPAFSYDSSADNSVEFELDSLEKKSVFKVTDITFTDTGWTKVTQNSDPDNPTTVNPSGTPWTLRADWIPDTDLSDGDQGMYGDMSYKVTGTASNVSATQLKINKSAVGEHFYWETATLKNYLNTLEDGNSYTGSITVNYTPGTAEVGKTPQLRTIIEGAYDGNIDTNLSSGTNTISIDEFIYSAADTRKDIMFELTGLEAGSIFQVTAINFTKQDSDWTNVKGGSDTATPWIITANNDGEEQWGHLRYKQTGTGVSSVQVKPMSVSMGDHFYWNVAKLTDMAYGQTLTAGEEYEAVITVQYTAGEAQSGKTPELLYNIPVAGISEETMALGSGSGTYTIDVPAFTYDPNEDNYAEFELDSLEKKSVFKVTDITFTSTGWKQVPKNTEFVPTGTPWTLKATNDQSTPGEEQWGDMSYKIDGTASDVNGTLIRPNATDVGEHYYWNTATLKNYLATLEDGCSYTGSITVNYTPGTVVAGKTPELRTVIEAANTGEKDTALTSGSNTISIDEFLYDSSAANKDILFELDGLEEGAIIQVTGITFTKQDADWTNVKGDEANPDPWTLTANYNGVDQWGHMRYKQTGTGVSSVEIKPINTAVGEHYYWNNAVLEDYLSDGANLTDGVEYDGQIKVQYTAGQAEAGKTPQLRYIMAAAETGEANFDFDEGSKTYTIDLPTFTYDASAGNDDIEFELDGLEKQSIFKVTEITFTPTGWTKVPNNTEFVPTGTPWTLTATNDQSTPGEEQWGNMSYKVDGTASNISSTLIRPNATDVGEHYYWNTATLKNYLATLEDGCSYTGSITFNYVAGDSVAGKTPELRTVIAAAGTGEMDTAVTAGSNTISISEFIYNSADENKDILFELDGLEEGSIFQVTGITFTKQDADWTNVKGDSANPTPWTLTANYNGVDQWGHMRYKQTGTGVSSVEIKPINTAVGEHYYWNNAVLEDYLSDGANLTNGVEYDATINVQYTAGTAEAGKTPQLRYIVAAAETGEANFDFDSGSGSYSIDLPTFTYDSSAGTDDIEFELDGLEKQSIFKVTSITFTPTGWVQIPKNTEFVPTGTPWTLEANNDQSTPGEEQWGDISYKVDGTASDISSTLIRPNATDVGEHYYWNTATLKNYLATLEDGCSYTGSITVNYTPGEAVAGKDPELRTVIEAANTGEKDTALTSGSNTISIDEFLYDSSAANKDILFELDGLEEGAIIQVTGITFTKQDADWTNVKGDEANPDPWTLTANYDGVTQWGHMRYKQTGTGVSSVEIKPINTAVGEHFYWNNAKLLDYLSDTANLENGKEYEGTITVQYTAGQAEAGKTPQLRYIVAAANTGEGNLDLDEGSKTYTIDLGKFIYDASAGNDDIEFELDGLEKQSIFQVTDITFEPTGWERIEQNDEVVPTDSQGNNTPWTLVATNDGQQQWGDMSVKVDGTASDVASTSIKLNTAAEGEHFYWNTATLKDYLATLEDGCSYTGSIVVNYTSGEATPGKTPELRTVIAGAFDGEKDTTLTNGTNTIAIDEFVYDAAKGEDDILFELTGLEKGSIFNVASITFTKQDADWINVKGDEVDADPWTITANNDGSTAWGHMRYKKTGTGVSSVQIKPINTAMGNHYYWNTASLEGYLANLVDGREYTATITLSYTAGEAEAGKTPQLRYIIEAANTGEANLNLNNGTNTYTIDIPKFTYEVEAGKNDIMFELDSLEKGSIFQVTDITFTPTGWDEVPISAAGFNPTGTPWTLKPINDGATTWGSMYYDIVGDPAAIGSTKMRVNNPGGEYDWNLAILEDYAKNNMEVGHSYTATIVYDYDDAPGKSGAAGDELKVAIDNNASIIDVGTTPTGSYTTDTFEYTGSDDDVTFFLDGLTKGSSLSVSSVTFTNQDGDFENVPNDTDFTPTGTPWTLKAINDPNTGQYGKLMYQVDGTPTSNIGSTLINLKNTVGQQETDEHGDPVTPENRWWWTSASLMDYNADLEPWMTYTGSITLEITETTAPNAKLYVYVDGEEYGFPLTQGENTLEIPAFIFKGEDNGGTNDVKFLLDELPTGANFRVTDITFTKDGNWVAVPDNRPADNQFEITNVPFSYQFRNVDGTMGRTVSGTRDWQIFAGQWGGAGAVLYYDPDFTAAGQPKVRIGAGERWDPACAQIKLPNPTEAYKELSDYTSYYMTYEFTSTEMGTVHITHEGYEPNRPERIDVTADMYDESDGLYHVKYQKKFTRCPETDYRPGSTEPNNLYLSLTPTTYADGGTVVQDGTALPLGTVLSNFKVEYQRTDEEVYTLVNDCRFDGHQDYTPIVSNATLGKGVLLGYTNSYFNGWMSYQNGVYAAGEDAIAQASIRLDETNGDFGPESDTRWAEHLRIPNDYFYGNRDAGGDITTVGTDTNGNPLKTGNHYKLRFYYNVDLSEAEGSIGQGKGIVLVQQGFGEPHRYPSHSGLNMANGTINTKSGYNSHSDEDYAKDGGIDFVYDDAIRTIDPTVQGNEFLGHVQFDFSDLPSGAKITDISWEFYAPQYKVFIDDVEDGSVVEGETYTFPVETGVIKYYDEANGVYYEPGDTIPFADFDGDIYVTAIRNYTAKVVDATDPTTVYAGPVSVQTGDKYTVPNVPGIASYTYNDQPVQPGDEIDVVGDIVIKATRAAGTYTITIDGELVDSVTEGNSYTFPAATGDYAGVTHFANVSDPTDTYDPEETVTPTGDISVKSVYTVTIVGTDGETVLDTFDVAKGDNFTFPAATGTYAHVQDFKGIEGTTETYNPEGTISGVDKSMTFQIEMVPQHTITIDGVDVATVYDGDTYTFPTSTAYNDAIYFVDGTGTKYQTGTGYTVNDDISVTSVYLVKIYNTDGQTELKSDEMKLGSTYTFPTTVGQVDHIKDFTGINGTTGTYVPTATITVDGNKDYKIERAFNVYIDGVQQQGTVDEGAGYTTPTDMPGVTKFIDTATQTEYAPGATIPNIQADLYLETVNVPDYTWTVDGNPGGTVPAGTKITLPDTAAIGYLLEYTDGEGQGVTDDLYKPGAEYTVNRNVNFISINEVNMQQTDKVSMYYKQGEDQRGMRFLGKLTVNEESDTNILSSDAFQTGMLICAEDTYYDLLGEDMTIEKAEMYDYLINAQNNSEKTRKWITGQPGSFACGIVDIKDYNIPRNFLSRGYVIVNYVDGESQVVYSDTTTPRSVKWIATQVFNDKTAYDKLASWKKEIVDYCKDYEEE